MAIHPSDLSKTSFRPRSVTLLAWLQFLQSLVILGIGIYQFSTHGRLPLMDKLLAQLLPLWLHTEEVGALLWGGLAIFGVLISLALLKLHPWAWQTSILMQGLILIVALVAYLRSEPSYVSMVAASFMVFYLNQREVRIAFRQSRQKTSEETELPDQEIDHANLA